MRHAETTFLADTLFLPFRGRAEAGKTLAERLKAFAAQEDAVVVAISNGGVPVAAQVAAELDLPLTIEVTGELQIPGHEGIVLGAVAADGTSQVDGRVARALHVPEEAIQSAMVHENQELLQRERLFMHGPQHYDFKDKVVLLVDEGIECPSCLQVAIQAMRKQGARQIIVAAPVGARQGVGRLRDVADQTICLTEPKIFFSVGHWYENFEPVSDWEVCQILDGLAEHRPEFNSEG